ncbi:hypothetical protein H7F15_06975 [Pontibacter sp. Tf4]|nr:hypothetical protein [Pontibacter sp. Tf4]MBB6610775.1 hypothetical protein [Pontibacter sp. Tf4]
MIHLKVCSLAFDFTPTFSHVTQVVCRKGRQPWYLLTGETLKVSVMPGT